MANLIFITNRTADDIEKLNKVADKVKTYDATQEELDLYYNQLGTGLKGAICRGDIFFRYYDIFNDIKNKAAEKGVTLTYPYAISNFKQVGTGSNPSTVKAAMDGLLTDGNYLTTLMGGTMPSNLLSYDNVNQFESTLQQIHNYYVNAIPKPTILSVTYTFDKTRHYNGYTTPDHVTMEGANSGYDRGIYTATYTPDDGYNWIDGTTAPITVTLNINVRYVTIPTVLDAFYDNGNLVYPTINGMDSNYVIQGGIGSAWDIGTYTIAFYLSDNFNTKWSNGYIDDQYIDWHVLGKVNVPTVTSNLTYNGNTQSPTIGSYDHSVIFANYSSEVDAGSYNVIFHLLDNLYAWSDGTTADKNVPWSIAKLSLTIPSVSGGGTYKGTSYTATVSDYNSTYESQSGDSVTQTSAGTYTVKWNLKNSTNTQWSDGTVSEKSGSWSITQKSISDFVVKLGSTLYYKAVEQTQTIKSVKSTDGTLTATYNVTGNTVPARTRGIFTMTITGTGNYTGTITQDYTVNLQLNAYYINGETGGMKSMSRGSFDLGEIPPWSNIDFITHDGGSPELNRSSYEVYLDGVEWQDWAQSRYDHIEIWGKRITKYDIKFNYTQYNGEVNTIRLYHGV